MGDPGVEKTKIREGHFSRRPAQCRGWPRVVLALFLLLGPGLAAMGCVETAECDLYVGCPEDRVCYQSQCLPRCSDDGDCSGDEVCSPCETGDDDDDNGRCPGDEGRACVEGQNGRD